MHQGAYLEQERRQGEQRDKLTGETLQDGKRATLWSTEQVAVMAD